MFVGFQEGTREEFRSNVQFDGWGKLFGDDILASAMLDRLLHVSPIFAANGPSPPPQGQAAVVRR